MLSDEHAKSYRFNTSRRLANVTRFTVKTILLTGATGFVGSHVAIVLEAAGYEVRYGSRSPSKARRTSPRRNWVHLDLERPETLRGAMAGCDAAIYLVHSMGPGHGDDYPEHERRNASAFAAAAADAQLQRVVYLGGVVPRSGASKHLQSRQRTGEVLRAGAVSTIELRAAMVIGAGSASWRMVRDLSRRLPVMVLPRWLRNTSYPIAIEDVVTGIVAALELPDTGSHVYELPGCERVTHRDMLVRTAAAMGHKSWMLSVPVLSPRLSSYWIALVTRTELGLAQELVEGVRHNLEPTGEALWARIGHRPMSIDSAIRSALDDDATEVAPSAAMRHRLEAMGGGHRPPALA